MKVMATATQTTKMLWMRRVRADRAVALRPALVMGRPSGDAAEASASGAFDANICGPSREPVNVDDITVHFLDRDKTRRT